jgi:dihydrofolate reductase
MGKLKMILAVDDEWGIGLNNSLPWDCKEDLLNFKKLTVNSAILMGKRTWESLPTKPLNKRYNIVLSTTEVSGADLTLDYNSSTLMKTLNEYMNTTNNDIWVIGGSTVYKQFIDKIDYLYITRITGKYNCDTFFNPFEYEQFIIGDGEILSDIAMIEIHKRLK